MKSSALPRGNVSFLPDITAGGRAVVVPGRENAALSFRTHKAEPESRDKLKGTRAHGNFSKDEVVDFRNSPKQNICIDMLCRGYHQSFRELLALIQKQAASREATGPEAGIWHCRPLEVQPDKLERLQHFLTRAEAAWRAGYYEEVYNSQVTLARYFEDPEDKWLSDYFYEASFSTAQKVKMDGGRSEAEANFNMGRICLERGQREAALEHYEALRQLTAGRVWMDEAGQTYYSRACQNLSKIYSLLADKMLESEEHRAAINTLLKASEMAKEAGDKKMEADTAYQVGLAYQLIQDHKSAKRFLNMDMEICMALGDYDNLGKAYKAIASSLESEGQLDEAVQYLVEFVEVSQGNIQHHSLGEACLYLGTIFISRRRYDEACVYFMRAYETAMELGYPALLHRSQVHLGRARALRILAACGTRGQAAGLVDVQRLLVWKENRSDMFNDASGSSSDDGACR